MISRSGVRFSAADTRALVGEATANSPGRRRTGPARRPRAVLRLPFEAEGSPPQGYDTAVLLPLRDAAAEDLVLRLLEEIGDPLLLALPALAEVTVDAPGLPPRTLGEVGSRWHVVRRHGRLDPALLADRPTEERARTGWQITWALPRDPLATPVPGVLHAPTPSDEPLPWPALLLASLPMEGTRRHVAPGPATDLLVEEAGQAYADLLAERAAAGDAVLSLLPPGLPAGVLDGALRRVRADRLPGTCCCRRGPGHVLQPRDAVASTRPRRRPAGGRRLSRAGRAGWPAARTWPRWRRWASSGWRWPTSSKRCPPPASRAGGGSATPPSTPPPGTRWSRRHSPGCPCRWWTDGWCAARGARSWSPTAKRQRRWRRSACASWTRRPPTPGLRATQVGPRAALEPAIRAAFSTADDERRRRSPPAPVAAEAPAGTLRPGDLPCWLTRAARQTQPAARRVWRCPARRRPNRPTLTRSGS